MSQDILGSLVRALVAVPKHRLGLVQDLANKLAGEEGQVWETQGKCFLRKQPSWVDLQPEPAIDPIIRVDRSKKPTYPDWVKKMLHPELENVGPAEYDIAKVEQWLNDGQKDGNCTTGNNIYAKLKEKDCKLLKTCLGLRDLKEIQKKGIAFFRKYFKDKAVFGWASVVQDHHDILDVPCLCEGDDGVILIWYWLGSTLNDSNRALRHTR